MAKAEAQKNINAKRTNENPKNCGSPREGILFEPKPYHYDTRVSPAAGRFKRVGRTKPAAVAPGPQSCRVQSKWRSQKKTANCLGMIG